MLAIQPKQKQHVLVERCLSVFSERRLSIVVALGLLPWLGIIFFTAGTLTAIHFLGYTLLIFAIGYSMISLVLPASKRTEVIVLAPSFGILVISALGAFWLRLGLSIIWIPFLWLVLMAPGAWNLWTDRALWSKSTIAYGWTLVVLSALIGLVYFKIIGVLRSGDRPPNHISGTLYLDFRLDEQYEKQLTKLVCGLLGHSERPDVRPRL